MLCHFHPVAPKIEVDPRYQGKQQVKAGKALILDANLYGIPTPKVTWYLNDEPVSMANGTTVEGDKTHSVLTVRRARIDNIGRFKVVAENKVGSDSAQFDAVLLGELKLYTCYHGLTKIMTDIMIIKTK